MTVWSAKQYKTGKDTEKYKSAKLCSKVRSVTMEGFRLKIFKHWNLAPVKTNHLLTEQTLMLVYLLIGQNYSGHTEIKVHLRFCKTPSCSLNRSDCLNVFQFRLKIKSAVRYWKEKMLNALNVLNCYRFHVYWKLFVHTFLRIRAARTCSFEDHDNKNLCSEACRNKELL